eukprot:5669171-Prymnesium_polylepis.1
MNVFFIFQHAGGVSRPRPPWRARCRPMSREPTLEVGEDASSLLTRHRPQVRRVTHTHTHLMTHDACPVRVPRPVGP